MFAAKADKIKYAVAFMLLYINDLFLIWAFLSQQVYTWSCSIKSKVSSSLIKA